VQLDNEGNWATYAAYTYANKYICGVHEV